MSVGIKDKITTSSYRQILFVQIISAIISLAGAIVDGIIISRYLGPVNMAAYGLGNPIIIIMVSFAFVLGSGSQAVCGQYMGRGQVDKVNNIMNRVILIGLMSAILFNILLLVFPTGISILLGADSETVVACSDYLRSFSFGAVGIVMTPVLIGFLQMDRDGGRALVSAIVYFLCSTAFDLINVLVLKWGMFGMGLTTAAAYIISVLVLFSHYLKKDRSFSLSFRQLSLKGLKQVFVIGLPSATFHLSNFVKILAVNLMAISVAGTKGLFVHTVLNSLKPVVMGFVTGSGTATLLMCSVIVGEGNRRSLHHTLKYILGLTAVIGSIIGILIFVLAGPVLSGFFCVGEAAEYSDMVVDMFKFFAISIPFCMLNAVIMNYYQSMKQLILSRAICVLENAVYCIGAMFILKGFMGINGIWLTFTVEELLTMLTLIIYVWIRTKHFPIGIHDIMLVPEDFGVDKNHRMNYTITEPDEIGNIYDKIMAFCEEHQIDRTKAMAGAHCMEELAVLAFEGKNRKKTYVDIYMTYKEDTLKLRMRDNCRPIDVSLFNPGEGRQGDGRKGDKQEVTQRTSGMTDKQEAIQRTSGMMDKQEATQRAPGMTDKQEATQRAPGMTDKQEATQRTSGMTDKQEATQRAPGMKDKQEVSRRDLGMKIVYGMAREVTYNVVLGLNVFRIVL